MTDADDIGWQGLSPALLRIWREIGLTVVTVLTLVVAVAAGFRSGAVATIAAVTSGAGVAALLWVALDRRFSAWGYAERADELLVRRGVVVRRVSLVPYGRLQYVDVAQGPLDRRHGIAAVVLHTAAAATDATIPGIPAEDASRLRDRLAERGEARAAGL